MIVLESLLSCPKCGFIKNETMPTDACQFYFVCESFKSVLRPSLEDCCVFCSYGSEKCPPVQEQGSCCR